MIAYKWFRVNLDFTIADSIPELLRDRFFPQNFHSLCCFRSRDEQRILTYK